MENVLEKIEANFPKLILSKIVGRTDIDVLEDDLITSSLLNKFDELKPWIDWFYNSKDSFNTLRVSLDNKVELFFKKLSATEYLIILNEFENTTSLINYLERVKTSLQEKTKSKLEIIPEELNSKLPTKPSATSDKINDALRIQNLIIPDKKHISANFKKFFVVHEQQDTVGGDFYWYKKTNEGCIVAIIDCTGHSVEGAMTSMVCNSILNQAFPTFDPANPKRLVMEFYEEMNVYNEKVKSTLDYGIGAEIGMFYFNNNANTVSFISSGISAFVKKNNEIELLRSKKIMDYTMLDKYISEVKIDKSNITELFFFSDGLTDQFDSNDDKKLGYKGVKRMLDKQVTFDSENYLKEINNWKGNNMQYDDITMIGISI